MDGEAARGFDTAARRLGGLSPSRGLLTAKNATKFPGDDGNESSITRRHESSWVHGTLEDWQPVGGEARTVLGARYKLKTGD